MVMKQAAWLTGLLFFTSAVWATPPPRLPVATGLKNPVSVAVGGDGRVYVATRREPGQHGDGAVQLLTLGKAVPFAAGLDDPWGLASYQKWLFVADRKGIVRIDAQGKADVFAPLGAFPTRPVHLHDVAVDPESGTLYVSDAGD